MKKRDLPKYLIWYVKGKNHKILLTTKLFSEHTNKKEWEKEIKRLSKLKIITDLKYLKIHE